tara:strand:- start:2820 stop:3068 length:249 start_codon:yes stop_codon:yes gene_type:complete
MKCSIIKKRDGQMYEVAFDGFDTIAEARVKLSNIANELAEGEWWSYANDELVYDVLTYKIVKTSSVSYDHSYGGRDFISINQ